MARLLPPESSAVEAVSREVGVEHGDVGALAGGGPGQRTWRWQPTLDSGGATASSHRNCSDGSGDTQRLEPRAGTVSGGAGCLATGCDSGSLGEPGAASAVEAREDRRRVKELERELHRKDKALAETAALLVLSKKLAAVFNDDEDAMTHLEDRQILMRDIAQARADGARLATFFFFSNIDPRTLQRWKPGDGLSNGWPSARCRSCGSMACIERGRTRPGSWRITDESHFCETPPARIVQALADEGIYMASESSFHRVLRARGQMHRRGRAQPPRKSGPPRTHIATRAGEVWCSGCDVPSVADAGAFGSTSI